MDGRAEWIVFPRFNIRLKETPRASDRETVLGRSAYSFLLTRYLYLEKASVLQGR